MRSPNRNGCTTRVASLSHWNLYTYLFIAFNNRRLLVVHPTLLVTLPGAGAHPKRKRPEGRSFRPAFRADRLLRLHSFGILDEGAVREQDVIVEVRRRSARAARRRIPTRRAAGIPVLGR